MILLKVQTEQSFAPWVLRSKRPMVVQDSVATAADVLVETRG
jgi:hypothetical protein